MLSIVDRRQSPVDHTRSPALCLARWAIGRDRPRRAGPLASVRICSNTSTVNFLLVLCLLRPTFSNLGLLQPRRPARLVFPNFQYHFLSRKGHFSL